MVEFVESEEGKGEMVGIEEEDEDNEEEEGEVKDGDGADEDDGGKLEGIIVELDG